jgi:hypothetical protein
MLLWRTFELCPFACVIRQFRCPFALEAATLDRAALALLHLRQHANDTSAYSSSCNAQEQSKLFQCEILHAHLPPTMTEMLRVLEQARPSGQPSRERRNQSCRAAARCHPQPTQHVEIALQGHCAAVYLASQDYRASSACRRRLRHQSSDRFAGQSLRQC